MNDWDDPPPINWAGSRVSSMQLLRDISAYEAGQNLNNRNGESMRTHTNLPAEYHGVNCSLCGQNLMPCKSHSLYEWNNNCNFGVPVVKFNNFSGNYYRIKVNEAPSYGYLNEEAEKLREKYPRNSLLDGELRYFLCEGCMKSKKWIRADTTRDTVTHDAPVCADTTVRQEFKSPSLHSPMKLEQISFLIVWKYVLRSLNIASRFKKIYDATLEGPSVVLTPNEIREELVEWIDSIVAGTMKARLGELCLEEIMKNDSKSVQRVKNDLYQMFLSRDVEKVELHCSAFRNKSNIHPEVALLKTMKNLIELRLVFKKDSVVSNENLLAFKELRALKVFDVEFRSKELDALTFFQTISTLKLEKLCFKSREDLVYEFCLLSLVHKRPTILPTVNVAILEPDRQNSEDMTPLALCLNELKFDCRIPDLSLQGLAFIYSVLKSCKKLELHELPPATFKVVMEKLLVTVKCPLVIEEFPDPVFGNKTFCILGEILPSCERLKIFSFKDSSADRDAEELQWPESPITRIRSLFIGEADISKFENFFKKHGENFWKTFPNVVEVSCPGLLLSCESFTKGLHGVESLELVPPSIPVNFRKKLPFEIKNLKRLFSWCCLDKHTIGLLQNNLRLTKVLLACVHGIEKLSDIVKYLSNRNVTELHLLELNSDDFRVSLDDFLAIARFYPDLKDSIFGAKVCDAPSAIPLRVQELKDLFEERKGSVTCTRVPRFCRCHFEEKTRPESSEAVREEEERQDEEFYNCRFPEICKFLHEIDPWNSWSFRPSGAFELHGRGIPAGTESDDTDEWVDDEDVEEEEELGDFDRSGDEIDYEDYMYSDDEEDPFRLGFL